jgi:hypothetical protein
MERDLMAVANRLFIYNAAGELLQFQNQNGEDIWFVTYDIPWPGPNTVDYIALIEQYAPGVVVQREMIDALSLAYQLANFAPITSAQVLAIVGTLPVYPTSMPRFPDANGGMESPDGWSIVDGDMVVTGGG